jgi:hypothetical protein
VIATGLVLPEKEPGGREHELILAQLK